MNFISSYETTKSPIFGFFNEKTDGNDSLKSSKLAKYRTFFSYCRIELPNQLWYLKIWKKPPEKTHYMFLYYVLIFWPILRLCVIINEVLIPLEFEMVQEIRCLEN